MMINNQVNLTSISDIIINNRVLQLSKNNYLSKLNTLRRHLLDLHPDFVMNDEIRLPLPDDVIMDFFAWLSINTDLPKKRRRVTHNDNDIEVDDDDEDEDILASNKQTISLSCMQGYKSALIWYYKQKKADFSSSLDTRLNSFIQVGYLSYVLHSKHEIIIQFVGL